MKPVHERIRQRIQYHGETSEIENLCLDDIHIPSFTPLINTQILRCNNIGYLTLNECQISSLANFPNIPRLICLQLQNNQIKSQELRYLINCTSLSNICLDNNMIETIEEFQCLRELEELEHIEVKGNPICNINNYRGIIFGMIPQLRLLDCQDRLGNEDALYETEDGSSSDGSQHLGFGQELSSIQSESDEEDDFKKYRKL